MNNFVDKLLAWSMFCMSIGLLCFVILVGFGMGMDLAEKYHNTSHCEVKTHDYIHEAPKEGN
jgi:hypothetical protein